MAEGALDEHALVRALIPELKSSAFGDATVRQVLGTPLLTDMFRSNRWDYVFTIKNRPGVTAQTLGFALFFRNGALVRYEGDEMPTQAQFAALVATPSKNPRVPALQATAKQLARWDSF